MPYHTLPRWWRQGGYRIVTAIVIAAALFASTLLFITSRDHTQMRLTCDRIDRLDQALVIILEASEAGLPANSYYHKHPVELRRAQQQIRRNIVLVQDAACSQ